MGRKYKGFFIYLPRLSEKSADLPKFCKRVAKWTENGRKCADKHEKAAGHSGDSLLIFPAGR
jgi:putative hemolysin